jgi:hypothetical protein
MSEKVYPWHLLDPKYERSDDETFRSRLDTCLACDRIIQLTKQCKECGCIMPLKAKLKDAACPLGKWKE